MKVLPYLETIDWSDPENRRIADALTADAKEYMSRLIDHIYKGNEIRSDSFMDASEKRDEIGRLDRKRTAAHDRMLKSFAAFLDLLRGAEGFDENDHRLANRAQIADFVAGIAFELVGMEVTPSGDGSVRDELADKLHKGEITFEQIMTEAKKAGLS